MAALQVTHAGLETQEVRAEPIDRFLSIPPVTHPLAVVQTLSPDMLGVYPILATVQFAQACRIQPGKRPSVTMTVSSARWAQEYTRGRTACKEQRKDLLLADR